MEFHTDIFVDGKWSLDVDRETWNNFTGLKRCGSRCMGRYCYYEDDKFIGNPFEMIGQALANLAGRTLH